MAQPVDCRKGQYSFYELAEKFGGNVPLKRLLTIFRNHEASKLLIENEVPLDAEDHEEEKAIKEALELYKPKGLDFKPRSSTSITQISAFDPQEKLLGLVQLVQNPFSSNSPKLQWRVKDSQLSSQLVTIQVPPPRISSPQPLRALLPQGRAFTY